MLTPPAGMAHYSTTVILSSIRELIQSKPSCDSQRPRTPSAFIHTLDNDSLLNIFFLCRPALSDENEEDAVEILGGRGWNDERWWYRLVQVCRRWRYLVLESASLLGLSLLCTYGTPVADMLAHSPPLPFDLDYRNLHDYITAGDELGIILALEHRDRVRRIRIMQPVHILQRLIKALHGEFPNLKYLFIERHTFYMPSTESNVIVDIPETFRAPRLRYLMVMGFHISIGSPIFTTMGNLVTLSLNFDIPWVYLHPNPLLRQLSVMSPSLPETSGITYNTYLHSDERRAVMRRVTPYLRRFGFQGADSYLEALLPRVTIRLLKRLQLYFLDQLKTYLILPRRLVISNAETVWLKTVRVTFLKDYLRVDAYSHDREFNTYRVSMSQGGRHLDWQLASVTKFFRTLGTVFSPVESLILRYDEHLIPSEWINEADPTQWRELFRTFDNLKALYMDYGLVRQLSRFLQPDEGESPTDLLLELRELWYSTTDDSDDAFFTEFVYARQNAGRPVAVFQAVIHR
ncbi:hypothetical protein F5888DRAFT_1100614 [Russula emetica]|nr:hypothetical protein F5888DRAFT_1100614 [Russula emetica]